MTDIESGFKKARLTEYGDDALRQFKDQLSMRQKRLSGLSSQYNRAVDSAYRDGSLDSGEKLARMQYWSNRRDVAEKMASSLTEDITMIDIELEVRSI